MKKRIRVTQIKITKHDPISNLRISPNPINTEARLISEITVSSSQKKWKKTQEKLRQRRSVKEKGYLLCMRTQATTKTTKALGMILIMMRESSAPLVGGSLSRRHYSSTKRFARKCLYKSARSSTSRKSDRKPFRLRPKTQTHTPIKLQSHRKQSLKSNKIRISQYQGQGLNPTSGRHRVKCSVKLCATLVVMRLEVQKEMLKL